MATILPGWYTGRVVHIHVKVHINGSESGSSTYSGGSTVHTGQMFFSQDVLNSYNTLSPYVSNSQSQTQLTSDGIYNSATSIAILEMAYFDSSIGIASGAVASMTLGVTPSTTEESK
eukprot:TRINITY_DN3981_c0_g2_i4.p1 TRINITY_DN3981_c0_g2~~TRINITY_DN3981_c0_g2_i4.p1  ORF type:complete len:117 (+),score=19.52 TRINITY_DN3981_c0_g2_i4:453-803(+)